MDVALGNNYAKGYLNVDLHSIDVDDVALPIVNFSDAKRHAPFFLISYCTTSYISVLMKSLVFKK